MNKLMEELADLCYRWRRAYYSMTRSEELNRETARLAEEVVEKARQLVEAADE